jgi:hypothetical protein
MTLPKATKVYAVTEGSYSDYHILALFKTRALADAHERDGEGDSVEEFLLYNRRPTRVTVYSINARIWPDGSVTSEHVDRGEPQLRSQLEWEYGSYSGPAKPIREARTLQAPYAGKDWLVRVSGTDKAKVLKAFRDRVGQARARTLGVEA